MLGDEDRLERLWRSAELLQPWSTGNRQNVGGVSVGCILGGCADRMQPFIQEALTLIFIAAWEIHFGF